MLDFIRVAAAVPDVAVGNAAENTDRIIEKAAEAENKSPQLTVFPELALTGYTCADLFFQQTLLRSAREGLKKIVSCSEAFSSVIAVGLPLEIHGALYNCAAVIYRGRLYGIVPKTYIPTYNEFYEKRWFTPGSRLGSVSLTSAELGIGELQAESIPAGRDLIFDTGMFRFGAEICEDLWATVSPGSLLALGGAEVIINLSASNETISVRSYSSSRRLSSAHMSMSPRAARNRRPILFSRDTALSVKTAESLRRTRRPSIPTISFTATSTSEIFVPTGSK